MATPQQDNAFNQARTELVCRVDAFIDEQRRLTSIPGRAYAATTAEQVVDLFYTDGN